MVYIALRLEGITPSQMTEPSITSDPFTLVSRNISNGKPGKPFHMAAQHESSSDKTKPSETIRPTDLGKQSSQNSLHSSDSSRSSRSETPHSPESDVITAFQAPRVYHAHQSIDYVEKHKRIELAETRINDGVDPDHPHPAMASFIADSMKKIQYSKDEKVRANNYDIKVLQQRIPTFWPKRVWNKEEDMMSEQSSLELMQQNSRESFVNPDDGFIMNDRPDRNGENPFPTPGGLPVPSLHRPVTLSFARFGTESSSSTEGAAD